MKISGTFADWCKSARELHQFDKKHNYKSIINKNLILTKSLFQDKIKESKKLFKSDSVDINELVIRLREDLIRNFGKMHKTYLINYHIIKHYNSLFVLIN